MSAARAGLEYCAAMLADSAVDVVSWSTTHPPEPGAWSIPRPRISAALESALDRVSVVEVVAPAGFGKSTALADWARSRPGPVAWVSLSAQNRNPDRLAVVLDSAFRAAMRFVPGHDEFTAREANGDRSSALVAAWIRALDQAHSRVVLVVDDCHVVPDLLLRGPVSALLEAAPRQLDLVLVSRAADQFMVRRRANGAAALIDAHTLRMTRDEVAAAALAAGRAIDEDVATTITQETGGWPVAVGLELLTPGVALPRADETVRAYIQNEVLDRLPSRLRQLVLSTCLVERFTVRAARELSGFSDVRPLLDDLLARGLFLTRVSDATGRISYQWHSRFARECREVLRHDRPEELERLSRETVAVLRDSDPLAALEVASKGEAPDLVRDLLADHWLPLLLAGDTALLRESLDSLPLRLRAGSTMMVIDAALGDLQGDLAVARMVMDRAGYALAAGEGRERLALAQGQLLITDSADPARGGVRRGRCVPAYGTLPGRTFLRCDRVPARVGRNAFAAQARASAGVVADGRTNGG